MQETTHSFTTYYTFNLQLIQVKFRLVELKSEFYFPYFLEYEHFCAFLRGVLRILVSILCALICILMNEMLVEA